MMHGDKTWNCCCPSYSAALLLGNQIERVSWCHLPCFLWRRTASPRMLYDSGSEFIEIIETSVRRIFYWYWSNVYPNICVVNDLLPSPSSSISLLGFFFLLFGTLDRQWTFPCRTVINSWYTIYPWSFVKTDVLGKVKLYQSTDQED